MYVGTIFFFLKGKQAGLYGVIGSAVAVVTAVSFCLLYKKWRSITGKQNYEIIMRLPLYCPCHLSNASYII